MTTTTATIARKAESTARRLEKAAKAEQLKYSHARVLTAAELAAELEMTPRQLRRAARKAGNGVGRGRIYATPIGEAAGMIAEAKVAARKA